MPGAAPATPDVPGPRRWWHAPWHRTPAWDLHRARIVSALDRRRLYDAIPLSPPHADHIRELLLFLATATPITPARMPGDAVTMNSAGAVRDGKTGQLHEFVLVYPFDVESAAHGRSVTAPFGARIFGRRVGDRVTWPAHGGMRSAVVESLRYQPEREGHYDR